MKPIRLSIHAREQLLYRGVSEEEVSETIRASKWKPGELGRLECREVFPYKKEWNEIYYNEKEVRPIFVEEENEIIVITI
jgi:hypothetical protein